MSTIETQPQSPIEKICPNCGTVLKKHWQACPNCGWTMTPRNISHGTAIASIACSILGLFIFGIPLGIIGAALGASAVMRKDKDKLGYIGFILGIIVFILGILAWIELFTYIYY